MSNRIWFMGIEGTGFPFGERESLSPEQALEAADWAARTPGAMIELYVQDDADTELGMPMVGWVVGPEGFSYGLGHGRTAALEAEVDARKVPDPCGAAPYDRDWFRSLLERSLTA